MRKENSIKNSVTSLISNILAIIIGFITQTIFIKTLGAEYLGLNGFFSNILTVFSLCELGIGTSVIYSLYKPVAQNDIEKIKTLLKFYQKTYIIISLVIFILSLIFTPFINKIIGPNNLNINIYIVYFLFILSLCQTYLFSYKRSIIYVNQKNYLINKAHIFYLLLMNAFQIIILIKTQNYYLYLINKIIFQLLENIIISFIANKKYPYIKDKNVSEIDKNTKNEIFTKVKSLIYHEFAYVVICGTDNILISHYFGLKTVGIYSNYYLIINAFTLLISSILEVTPSVGNLLQQNNKEKNYENFKKINFINLYASLTTSTLIFISINPFINMWLGKDYLLSEYTLLIIVINYFQTVQRNTYHIFKNSSGIWEDKNVPIIEAILNIVFSIILLKIFGLKGVFMGTIISSLVLWLYSYPKYLYKPLFNKPLKTYFIKIFKQIMLFIFVIALSYSLQIKSLILAILVSIFIPSIVMYIIYKKCH